MNTKEELEKWLSDAEKREVTRHKEIMDYQRRVRRHDFLMAGVCLALFLGTALMILLWELL